MIDREKYYNQILDEIYGFDYENPTGRDIRLKILKNTLKKGRKDLSKISLETYIKDNGEIKRSPFSIAKYDDSHLDIRTNFYDDKIILSTKSNDKLVLKILKYDSDTEYFFYQELIFRYDALNSYYIINTKCIDKETKYAYGYNDYSNISENSRFGFSWDKEISTSFPYINSDKIINDLDNEMNKIKFEIEKEKSKLNLTKK